MTIPTVLLEKGAEILRGHEADVLQGADQWVDACLCGWVGYPASAAACFDEHLTEVLVEGLAEDMWGLIADRLGVEAQQPIHPLVETLADPEWLAGYRAGLLAAAKMVRICGWRVK